MYFELPYSTIVQSLPNSEKTLHISRINLLFFSYAILILGWFMKTKYLLNSPKYFP